MRLSGPRGLASQLGPTAVFASAALAATGALVVEARSLWFFGDDWDFLLQRSLAGQGSHGLLTPHNEHWSTLPIIVFRVLFAIFGLRHYLPYALTVIALHLVVVTLVWSLMLRSGIRPWIAAGFGGLLVLMGAGAENTLWDFQIGFVGSLAFGFGALWCMHDGGSLVRRDLVTALLLTFGLTCSGQGLAMLATVGVYAALTRGLRVAVAITALPVLTYLVWYGAYGRHAMRTGLTASAVGRVPAFLWTGLGGVWEAMTGVLGVGVLVVLGSVVILVRETQRGRLGTALPYAGLAGALTMYTLAGLTRAQLGNGEAQVSRYVYIAAMLTAPLVAAACQRLLGDQPVATNSGRSICLAIAVIVGVSGLHSLDTFAASRRFLLAGIPQRVVGAVDVAEGGSVLLASQPDPVYNPNIFTTDLVRARRAGKLPDLGPNRQGVLDASAALLVSVREAPFKLPAPASFSATGIEVPRLDLAKGCVAGRSTVVNGYLDVPVTGPGIAFALQQPSGPVLTQLVRGSALSVILPRSVPTGQEAVVGSTARGMTLRIIFPMPVSFDICPQP